ncbi:MAG TPA: ribonuclease III [Firmicutes bacterium]|nr:ribonuclease III [Bacillota bacterium]
MQEVQQLPALQLAYIGDAVYELALRAHLLSLGPVRIEQLHKATVHWVQAPSQAAAAHMLLPELTETEVAVFYRGRNVKPARIPKSASVSEYCYSTALEALFGYLYLTEQTERLQTLIAMVLAAKPHEK